MTAWTSRCVRVVGSVALTVFSLGCSHEASTANHAGGASAGSASASTSTLGSTSPVICGGTQSTGCGADRTSIANGGVPASRGGATQTAGGAVASSSGGAVASSSGGAVASSSGGAVASSSGGAVASSSGGAVASSSGGAVASSSGGAVAYGGSSPTSTVTYQDDASAIFPSPERGFYHHAGSHAASHEALDLQTLIAYRNEEAVSLVLRIFYLEPFRTSDISAGHLTAIRADLDTIRAAGLKAILRFAYTEKDTAPYGDATPARVLGHIAQLTPILQQNADVILTVQAGFIGAWGEWYYTDSFGDQGVISSAQWTDRRAVVDALLAALPSSRAIQLRTPAFKQHFFGTSALSSTEAFTELGKARVGHHNDCFVASSDDYGTYNDVTADKAYLATENLYVLQGGETCAVSSYSGFDNAAAEMQRLHYTYLNRDYNQDVLNSWGDKLDVVRRSLGYRLTLQSGTYASSGHRGGVLPISLVLRNQGYAPPIGPRALDVLLRNVADRTLYRAALPADPRRFTPGTTHTVSAMLCVPNDIPAGSYDLLLHLPDPSATLHDLPAYALRLSNTGLWEPTTGYHDLKHRLTISEQSEAFGCASDAIPVTLVPSP